MKRTKGSKISGHRSALEIHREMFNSYREEIETTASTGSKNQTNFAPDISPPGIAPTLEQEIKPQRKNTQTRTMFEDPIPT